MRLAGGHRGHRPFEHRSPAGDKPQRCIARTRRLVRDRWWYRILVQNVYPDATGLEKTIGESGQLRIADHPKSGEEVVRLMELSNAGTVPLIPRRRWIGGHFRGVAFQHYDIVSIAGQHHRGTQPDHASAADDDSAHASPPATIGRCRCLSQSMHRLCAVPPVPHRWGILHDGTSSTSELNHT